MKIAIAIAIAHIRLVFFFFFFGSFMLLVFLRLSSLTNRCRSPEFV